MPDEVKKACVKCGVWKCADEFLKVLRSPTGRGGVCKACNLIVHRERYAKSLKQPKTQARRQAELAAIKRYKQRHPEKRRAHGIISQRVARGKLIKPQNCQMCQVFSLKLEGHHEDYSKPLDVMWLCRTCHKRIHRKVLHVAA